MPYRALLPLMFLSGAAALMLEVSWFRRTAQIVGGTSLSMSAVLAAVIGGMAAGAFLFGRVADRVARPVRLYAWLELGVAALALASPWLLDASSGLFVALYRTLGDSPALLALTRFGCAALLLAPPAILMGGTLPALAAAVRTRPERLGRAVGGLYAANTLGAVAGTLLAGFFVLPALGLAETMRAAAVLSALAGGLALCLRSRPVAHEPTAPASGMSGGGPAARRAVILYAASGFLGLACEVAFTRSLVLVFGSTTYAFSAMLAVFLLGIGLGGAAGTRVTRHHLRRLEATVVFTAIAFSLAAVVVFVLPRLYLSGALRFGFGFEAGLALRFALAAMVLLPGAFGLGFAFPLAVQVQSVHAPGAGVGRLYAANTVASVLGSVVAVFVAVPLLGPRFGVVAIACGVALLVATLSRRKAVALGALFVLVGCWPVSPAAQERLHAGVYFDPDPYLRDGEIDEVAWSDGADVTFVCYGFDATVAVKRWSGRHGLLIDGKAVATDQVLSDEHHLALLGHLPMAVHPNPQRVLVVGLGLGTTLEAVATHRPARVRVVELEDAVAKAHRHLGRHVEDLVIADARTYLRATDEIFDVITCDPIHPWVRGGGDLYTVEYLRTCRARLASAGVMCLWLPVYQMALEDVQCVLKTFTSVFNTDVYYGGGDLVVIGAVDAAPPDPRAVELAPIFDKDLTRLRVARHEQAVAASSRGERLTDDGLRLEFAAPRYVDNREMAGSLAWIRTMWEQPPVPYGAVLDAQVAVYLGDEGALARAMQRAEDEAPGHGFVANLVGEESLWLAREALDRRDNQMAVRDLAVARHHLGDDVRLDTLEADLCEALGDRAKAHAILSSIMERLGPSDYLRRKLDRLNPGPNGR